MAGALNTGAGNTGKRYKRVIKKIIGYSLLAICAYVTFLVVELPADVVWRYARPHVPVESIPVEISSVHGRVWDGRGMLSYQGQPAELRWRLQPWRQFLGQPVLSLELNSMGSRVSMQSGISWGGVWDMAVQGQIDLIPFNSYFSRQGISLDGTVKISDLRVRWDTQEQALLAAQGLIQWSGGTIGYPVAGQTQRQQMPGLLGVIEQQDSGVSLNVKENMGSSPIIEATLQHNGQARLAVRRKLLDLAGAPWSTNSTPQDVVFRIQQKLF